MQITLSERLHRQAEEARQLRQNSEIQRLHRQLMDLQLQQHMLQPRTFIVPSESQEPPRPSQIDRFQQTLQEHLGEPVRPQPSIPQTGPDDILGRLFAAAVVGSDPARSRLVGSGDLAMISSLDELWQLARRLARELADMEDDAERAYELDAILQLNSVLHSLVVHAGSATETPAALPPAAPVSVPDPVATEDEPVFRRVSSSERIRPRLIA